LALAKTFLKLSEGIERLISFTCSCLEEEMRNYSNGRFNSDEIVEAIDKHRREHGDCYFENNEIKDSTTLSAKAQSFREKKLGWPMSPNSFRRVTSVKIKK
jgi:hypothetical protein